MKICFIASECTPYVKTGGLADVSGALPRALDAAGCEVKVFLPLYGSIHTEQHNLIQATDLGEITVHLGNETVTFNTWYGKLPDSNAEVYFIDFPRFYHRPTIYTNDPDEGLRFILLQHAVFHILQRYHWQPDVMHCNDWQTALIPAMLRLRYEWDDLFRPTASVYSIHNIGYQGRFDQSLVPAAQLPPAMFYPMGPFEFWGAFSFMKAGLSFSEVISTVSEQYAREIQTPEFGEGLDGILTQRSDVLVGILNGIDTTEWNPTLDPDIAMNYSAESLEKKQANKAALLAEMNLPYRPETPVIGIVSRLAGSQKGFDLLQPIMEELLRENDVQFVILGSGDQHLEVFFEWIRSQFPEQVGIFIGYNNGLAHRIEAGSDMFLMPSRYEPCGLNQMYSLAYGTVPIVRHTGGLADTVRDYHAPGSDGNGFSFKPYEAQALKSTILRALEAFGNAEVWRRLVVRGMEEDFSWARSAQKYLDVYRRAIAIRQEALGLEAEVS